MSNTSSMLPTCNTNCPCTTRCSATYRPRNYSIGYMREDGDLQLLVTINDNDKVLPSARLKLLAFEVKRMIQEKLSDETIVTLERQDAPDYVSIDEE